MNNTDFIKEQRYERAKKRVRALSGFYKHFAVYVIVNGLMITIKYFNLQQGEDFFSYKTFSTAGFWGIGLICHALGVFGSNLLGHDWEERKIAELMEKEHNQKWK